MEALAVAKFKTCQCIRMTDLPNLTLAKVSHYTVYGSVQTIPAYIESIDSMIKVKLKSTSPISDRLKNGKLKNNRLFHFTGK